MESVLGNFSTILNKNFVLNPQFLTPLPKNEPSERKTENESPMSPREKIERYITRQEDIK